MGLEYKPAPQPVTMASPLPARQRTLADVLRARRRARSTEVVRGPQSGMIASPITYGQRTIAERTSPMSTEVDHRWTRPAYPWWNADQVPPPCPSCNEVPDAPRFLVSIRSPPEPTNQENDFYLVVPGHFWELHSSMLECDELQLKGPNKEIMKVKVTKTYREREGEQKLSVRLESNWKTFFLANNLQVGDILEFFLVASSCFTVYRLERWK